MGDFNSTYGRVFGNWEEPAKPAPPPPPSGKSPLAFSPPDRPVGDREMFGVGFRRNPVNGPCSPSTRSSCVQDIGLRDRSSPKHETLNRYDAAPAVRGSPPRSRTDAGSGAISLPL